MTDRAFYNRFSRSINNCSLNDVFDCRYTSRERAMMLRESAWRAYYAVKDGPLGYVSYYGMHPMDIVIVNGNGRYDIGFNVSTLEPWSNNGCPTDVDLERINAVVAYIRPLWEKLSPAERVLKDVDL